MAENEFIYKLTVDTSGTETDGARRALESLKKQILETEREVARLKAGIKDGSTSINEASGPLSQYESRLKALRTTFNETARAATGLEGFTSKIGKQFRDAVGPINDLVGRLGPIGNVINQVSAKLGDIGKASAGSADGVGKLNGFTSALTTGTSGALLAVGALTGGIAALGVGIASSVKAYDESVKASRQLEVALDGNTAAAKRLQDQAQKLQDITGIPDESITRAQAFAASLGLTADQIQQLTPAVVDLAAATGQNVESAFESVATTLSGGRDALKKYGIELDATASKSEQVGQVIEGLSGKFGGQAEAIGASGANAIKSFQTQIGELEEVLGGIIVRGIGPFIEGLTDAARGFLDLIGPAESAADAFDRQVQSFVDTKVELDGLLGTYDELKGKQTLTATEQETLNQTIQRIGEVVPSAITGVNEYGKALDINRDKVNNYVKSKIALLKVENEEAIAETKKGLEEQQKLLDEANKRLNGGIEGFVRRNGVLYKDFFDSVKGQTFIPVKDEEVAKLQKNAETLGETVLGLQAKLESLNGDAIQKEIDRRNAALKAEADAVDAATAAYQKGIATEIQLTAVRKRLNEELSNIPANERQRIQQKLDEIALVDRQIAAFKREGTARTESAASAVKATEERLSKISAAYDLEIAKVDDAENKKLITQIEADTRRNQALSKFLDERIKLETDAAEKAAEKNGGEIPIDFKLRINGLEEEKRKVDGEVEKFKLEAQAKIREIAGKVELQVSADLSELEKQLSDAVAFDDLRRSFEDAFADTANSVSNDVREALLNAAADGTINFDGLIINGEVPKEIVEDLQRAYELFRLNTERNKITLIRDGNLKELDRMKKRFEELTRIVAELDQKKADPTVTLTAEEETSYTTAKEELNTLDGKITETTLKVNADTSELNKNGEAIGQVTDQTTGDQQKGDKSFFADLFGISDEEAEIYVGGAIDLANSIGDAIYAAQQAQIERRLALTNQAIADERDVTLRGIEDRVNAGLITEEEANRLRERANKDAEEKRRKAQREAVEADRKIKSSQATISFFSELAQLGLSSRTLPPGASEVYYAIQAGISAARYAANLAAINSTPVAAKGTIVKAQDGMMAEGPSHADGGILGLVSGKPAVELEGGEAIINKQSSKLFAPLLSMINSHNGWGIPLAAQGGITRGTALVNARYTEDELEEMLSGRMEEGGIVPASHTSVSYQNSSITKYASGGYAPTSTYTSGHYINNVTKYAFGGMVPTVIPRFDRGGITQQTSGTYRVSVGGMVPKFEFGGMIPADGTIANRRQLEIATANSTERVVKLNGDQRASKYTVYVDDLARKMDGIRDAENNVTFGI